MRSIGLGCMRLSTDAARSEEPVIDAAIAAGVTLLDTADVYCHSDADIGHNELLVAHAPPHVRIVTKGGLTRPDGAWVPNGRANHLAAAARASLARLGRIDLYLLHVVDPKVPLATSVRALAKLVDDGIVPAIGLSNVNLTQLEAALALAPIRAVELELSPTKLDALRSGLLDACTARSIEVLAYRPFGGPRGVARIQRDPVVGAHATRLGCTPHELVLAWLRTLSPMIVPLPGATRVETARSAAHVVELDAAAIDALNALFVPVAAGAPTSTPGRRGEVVIVMGIPGAGKSTLAADLVARGYLRLNRDERGGSLLDLARALDVELAGGATHVVVDNTYPSRASRAPILEVARTHYLPVRCVVLDTPIERAQHNAVLRMLARHERLLEPAEIRGGDIGPGAQFRWRRDYEPPRADEGFASIDVVEFEARASPAGTRAILVELDDLVWRGRPRTVDKVALRDGALDALRAWHAAGVAIAATSWQPGVERAAFEALVVRVRELLGMPLLAAACHHAAGPPVCWCRKPMPGLALDLARRHALAFELCIGASAADRGFATRAELRFHDAREGWPLP